jgi:DUF971 family protein
MADAPQQIRSLSELGCLELVWAPDRTARLPFRLLRESCPCAACVDENTGQKILDISTIPDDIRPDAIGFSGNYALKIGWSDGHHTGLFTWDYLDELSRTV